MSPSIPRFHHGDEVRRQSAWDQVGTIQGEGRLLAGEYWYQVRFDATNRPQLPESDLVPYEGGHDLEGMLLGGRFAGREAFSKLITFTRLRQPLSDNLYSIFASRTEFQPYQFKPLLKFLGSLNGRLLVADEVGLGKTIEAGLIMIEERARHGLDRVLVVCPSSLCEKWRVEMRNRFDEEFSILDAPDIRRFLEDTTQHGEGVRLRGICSIQTLRGRTLRSDWEAAAPPLDLVIVDEAHHLRNPETQAHQLGRLLSETANAMLLLTATPVHLGNQNLFYLLRILNPEEYQDLETFNRRLRANLPVVNALRILGQGRPPDLARCLEALRDAERGSEASHFRDSVVYQDVVGRLGTMPATDRGKVIELQRDLNRLGLLSHVLTRTRKTEIEVRVKREAHLIRQSLSPLEMQFYQALSRHVFERYAALGADSFAAFAAIMPQRQAASCIPAMVEHYSEELGVKADDSSAELSDLSPEDWVGEEEGDARPEHALPDLRQILKRFAGVDKVDSKFDALLDTLRDLDRKEPGCKVVVFSYFKRTLEYLHRRLSTSGFRGAVISGSYPDEERQRRIAEFRDEPGTQLLLSSEVGSEGLDFQFCHIMVNYDLPWNPMVIEQRIGRLDRFGQPAEKILIFNFSIPNTIEERILRRLYERIRIFEESVGDLEAILGEQVGQLTRDLLRPDLTDDEKEDRIRQAADVIEQHRQDAYDLERKSAEFLGTDAFFEDELDRIQRRRRFVTPDALALFIRDFLQERFPECSLTQETTGDVYLLGVSPALDQFLRDHLSSDDLFLRRFFRRVVRGRVRVTFEAAVALVQHDIEFMTSVHPVPRAICRWYENHRDALHPVARLRLRTERCAPGRYLYVIHLVTATGARPSRTLEGVVVSLEDGRALDREMAEDLVSDMVARAESEADSIQVGATVLERARQQADEVLGMRLAEMRRELGRLNEAMVDQRLTSLDQSFGSRIQKREEMLLQARRRGSAPQYLRMLEGMLRNTRDEHARRRMEIERVRTVNVSFETVALGLLEVAV